MIKKKEVRDEDAPNWFFKPPTTQMTRDVEDALADLFNHMKLNPRKTKKNHVTFGELPMFLHGNSSRWNEVDSDNFKPNDYACFKTLF